MSLVARKSTSHTTRDASKESTSALQEKFTSEDVARSSPSSLTDPTFLKDTLATIYNLDEALERDEQLVDIDYELSDVI